MISEGQTVTIPDVLTALDGAVLLVDTREQDTRSLRQRLEVVGWPCERIALPVGDYSAKFPLPDGEWLDLRDRVCIERKMSFGELAMCYTHQRERFRREFERAEGRKIYLLVEGATWENLYNGKYHSKISPQAFVASVLAWAARYNCVPIFCKSETSGLLIRDILYREAKEILERMTEENEKTLKENKESFEEN